MLLWKNVVSLKKSNIYTKWVQCCAYVKVHSYIPVLRYAGLRITEDTLYYPLLWAMRNFCQPGCCVISAVRPSTSRGHDLRAFHSWQSLLPYLSHDPSKNKDSHMIFALIYINTTTILVHLNVTMLRSLCGCFLRAKCVNKLTITKRAGNLLFWRFPARFVIVSLFIQFKSCQTSDMDF